MKEIKHARWALALALLLTTCTGTAATVSVSYPFSAPGIATPNYPSFSDTNESISLKKIGASENAYWQMTGSDSITSLISPTTSYAADHTGNHDSHALDFKTQLSDESLWLLANNHDFKGIVKALDDGSSNDRLRSLISHHKKFEEESPIASVPVPGAAWLFGTGLMTLLAGRRKGTSLKTTA